MNYRRYAWILLSLWGCQASPSNRTESAASSAALKSVLPGTWETVSFQVTVQSFQNSDSTFVFAIGKDEWGAQLGIQPIQTAYHSDNKFLSEYKNKKDSLVNSMRGIWNTFGDTLLLITPEATYQYIVKITADQIELRAMLDWDGDGQEDDEYIGIQKRVQH